MKTLIVSDQPMVTKDAKATSKHIMSLSDEDLKVYLAPFSRVDVIFKGASTTAMHVAWLQVILFADPECGVYSFGEHHSRYTYVSAYRGLTEDAIIYETFYIHETAYDYKHCAVLTSFRKLRRDGFVTRDLLHEATGQLSRPSSFDRVWLTTCAFLRQNTNAQLWVRPKVDNTFSWDDVVITTSQEKAELYFFQRLFACPSMAGTHLPNIRTVEPTGICAS